MRSFVFMKEDSGWYVDLPEFIEQGGSKGDLQMVEGADAMLDIIAEGKNKVTLIMDENPFENSTIIELLEKCDPIIGGGYYLLPKWKNKTINQRMWLCGVTEFVFGYLPAKIFIREMV